MALFLDTTIFIYHMMGDHPEHSPRCSALFRRIERGEVKAVTAVTAVDEALRVITRTFGKTRSEAAMTMTRVVQEPEIEIEHRWAVLEAMTFWAAQSPLSFVDCYHLALTRELGLSEICTFDRKMDRFPGVGRVEP